ncbi:MAG: hypothetical protein ABF636_11410 [Acetobacter sp.]
MTWRRRTPRCPLPVSLIALARIEIQFQPGERITHHEYGQGVVLEAVSDGYLRAFFGVGERRVPVASLRRELTRTERILRAVHGSAERSRKAWLSYEAYALPVMESASALTSAKIDLLPHQVVLTHRIATASPRRYLIADEVGLLPRSHIPYPF